MVRITEKKCLDALEVMKVFSLAGQLFSEHRVGYVNQGSRTLAYRFTV